MNRNNINAEIILNENTSTNGNLVNNIISIPTNKEQDQINNEIIQEKTVPLITETTIATDIKKIKELKINDLTSEIKARLAEKYNRSLGYIETILNHTGIFSSEELEKTLKINSTIKHSAMLKELLATIYKIYEIEKIDFRDEANLEPKENLRTAHYLIIVINKILELTKERNWDLCRKNDFIYAYNKAYWDLIDEEELKTFLGTAAEIMGVDPYLAKHYNFIDQLFKQFIVSANLPTPKPLNDTVFINLQNGTLIITSQGATLKPHDRADFLTYQLSFDYDPKAIAPLFEQYLNKVLPDPDKQKVLLEYAGYIFISNKTLKLEKTLLLHGSGANGKSVFYEILMALLGEQNVSGYSLQSLTNENGYYRAMISNKLVNYASEINGKLEASTFKQIVSGEPVEARLPYGRPFTVTNYAKLIFNCNELPKDVENTIAFFRRFLIIAFDITIPEADQDKDLAKKIIASELSGILNLMLNGLRRLLEQRQFTYCEAVEKARKQYEIESDSVKLFIHEFEYIANSNQTVLLSILYNFYKDFCISEGCIPVKKRNFRNRLKNIGFVSIKRNTGVVVFAESKFAQ